MAASDWTALIVGIASVVAAYGAAMKPRARGLLIVVCALLIVVALAIGLGAGSSVTPTSQPPRIDRFETRREGALVYLRMYFTDPNGDVQGFGFRGANGAGWAEENHSFANPSFGQVGPGWIEYPFN